MEINTGAIGSGYSTTNYGTRSTSSSGTRGASKIGAKTASSQGNDAKNAKTSDAFKTLVNKMVDDHTLTSKSIKKEDDWRKMEDREWDKLIEDVDKYIEAYKEQLEKLEEKQDEAAVQAAMEAGADMKSTAASSAALSVATGGMVGNPTDKNDYDEKFLEKSSWTYELESDDQAILLTAKRANNLLHRSVGNNFPYSSKAEGGVIEYNGVVFVGDAKTNSLNLGDMSNPNNVMHIQLSDGGFLNVNFDNIGDLKDAIGMFSGKDQGIILKAIAAHNYEQGFMRDAEEEEAETIEKLG